MKLTPTQIADALITATEGKSGPALAQTAAAFVRDLHRLGMLHRFREVLRAVDGAWKRRYGVSRLTVETASPLPPELRERIEELAKGADVQEAVVPELIGGARIRLDDRLIDGSVAGHLERIKKLLT